jgi:hypothetical protein
VNTLVVVFKVTVVLVLAVTAEEDFTSDQRLFPVESWSLKEGVPPAATFPTRMSTTRERRLVAETRTPVTGVSVEEAGTVTPTRAVLTS